VQIRAVVFYKYEKTAFDTI